MAHPPVSFFTLAEVYDRWEIKPIHVAAWVLEGKLTVSTGFAGIRAEIGYYEQIDDEQWQRMPEGRTALTGIFDLSSNDAWLAMRNGQHVLNKGVPDQPNGYIDLDPDNTGTGVTVAVADLLVRRSEVERFEAEIGISRARTFEKMTVRSGPGAPPRFAWDDFWIEACRRVHDDGLPATQAEMIRDLLDWFADEGLDVPDRSTVKKRISRLWRALGHADTAADDKRGKGRDNVA